MKQKLHTKSDEEKKAGRLWADFPADKEEEAFWGNYGKLMKSARKRRLQQEPINYQVATATSARQNTKRPFFAYKVFNNIVWTILVLSLIALVFSKLATNKIEDFFETEIKEERQKVAADPAKLRNLNLSRKKLSKVPLKIAFPGNLEIIDITSLHNLESLELHHNYIIWLPKEIGKLTNLQKLYVYNNQLGYLPEAIGKLKKLNWLEAQQNKLTALPKEIGKLTNLEWLVLNHNQLPALPKEIGELKKLKWLLLGKNKLERLPEEIGQLKDLYTLNVENNLLVKLPYNIGQLENLQTLNLSGNQLAMMPWEIGKLKNLEWLALENNKLVSLPAEIGRLKNLKTLMLKGNNISEAEQARIRRLLPSCKIYF